MQAKRFSGLISIAHNECLHDGLVIVDGTGPAGVLFVTDEPDPLDPSLQLLMRLEQDDIPGRLDDARVDVLR